jgi:ATP-dependent DNA ligase
MARIEIKTDGIRAHIFIDGHEIPHVTGYQLSHKTGEIPTLQLSLLGLFRNGYEDS